MKVFEQEFLHDPANGIVGDCFRACIATVLSQWEPDIELSDVPHFGHEQQADGMMGYALAWLHRRGYKAFDERVDVAYGSLTDTPLSRLAVAFCEDRVYISTGVSPRFPDCLHSVVMRGAALCHDPHPDKTGVNALYFLTWICQAECQRNKFVPP